MGGRLCLQSIACPDTSKVELAKELGEHASVAFGGGKVPGAEDQSTAVGGTTTAPSTTSGPSPRALGGHTITNRLTGKYLKIPGASTTIGTAAGQWDGTDCACQLPQTACRRRAPARTHWSTPSV